MSEFIDIILVSVLISVLIVLPAWIFSWMVKRAIEIHFKQEIEKMTINSHRSRYPKCKI